MSDVHSVIEDEDSKKNQSNKYLLFNLGREEFGLALTVVTSIEELPHITPLPGMPEYITGVINLREKIIPAIDLRLRIGMKQKEYSDRTCIIIVIVNESLIGFIVDNVLEITEILDTDLSLSQPENGHDKEKSYIAGLTATGKTVRIILDAERILNTEILSGLNHKLNG